MSAICIVTRSKSEGLRRSDFRGPAERPPRSREGPRAVLCVLRALERRRVSRISVSSRGLSALPHEKSLPPSSCSGRHRSRSYEDEPKRTSWDRDGKSKKPLRQTSHTGGSRPRSGDKGLLNLSVEDVSCHVLALLPYPIRVAGPFNPLSCSSSAGAESREPPLRPAHSGRASPKN